MDKIGFWNSRGLNGVDKQKEMQIILYNSKISMFGFLETRIKRVKAKRAALNLCRGWSFTTDLGADNGGRIWILWKP